MKATSIFGGVQVFNIIIAVIRSKFIAVLLGPAGMGIIGLLTSATGLIANLTNFGLGTSAVKEIAAANSTGDQKRIEIVVSVVRKMVWITGLIGFLVVGILSPWLSVIAFGDKSYTLAFIWISITLLFNQLSSGQLVVLQGLRKLNYLAKANLSGSFMGLLITVPIYYFLGIDGIVPGIISTSLISLGMSWYFSGKVKFDRPVLTYTKTFAESRNMLKMGLMISLNGILVIGASYLIRIFVSRTGGIEQVGLYNSGFTIINTYVSLIFNAMATDYFPRLSAVSDDLNLYRQTINQQAEIALLILAPILLVFLVFINWVIILLYSQRFIAVNEMIQWAAMGMFFKTIGWSISFVFLAKGTTKLFFWNELIATVYILGFNILGYHYWGLEGLGLSFAVAYLIYSVQVFIVSNVKFNFRFDKSLIFIFAIQFSLAFVGFLMVKYFEKDLAYYITGIILFILSGLFSVVQLNKKVGLTSFFKQYLIKNKIS